MEQFSDFIALAASNIWLFGGSFLLILSVLVVVHEWGHYSVARLCGVKIDEFAVGFGKELFGFKDRSGTRWKICLLPIGGYVKMFGDTDPAGAGQTDEVADADGSKRSMTDAERKQAFFSKSVAQRAAIVFAGPAINFIFAILLLSGMFMFQGKEIIPPTVAAVQVGAAGEKADFRPGDTILAIDGVPTQDFEELRRTVMLGLDKSFQIDVLRDGQKVSIIARPQRLEMEDRFGFKHERGYLGVYGPTTGFDLKTITEVDGKSTEKDADKTRQMLLARMGHGSFQIRLADAVDSDLVTVDPIPAKNEGLLDKDSPFYDVLMVTRGDLNQYQQFGFFSAFREAVVQTYAITRDSLYALGQMITGMRSATELGGIIRIGAMAGDMAEKGVIALITFTALLSINLGLVNLFPIPMLDGGHLAFYAVEAVRGRPIPERFQEYAFRFGLVMLVFLMVFANINDIMQLIL